MKKKLTKKVKKVSQAFLDDQLLSTTIFNRMDVSPQLRQMPHTGATALGKIPLPCSKVMNFLEKIRNNPWREQLTFVALILASDYVPVTQYRNMVLMNVLYERAWRLQNENLAIIEDKYFFLRRLSILR